MTVLQANVPTITTSMSNASRRQEPFVSIVQMIDVMITLATNSLVRIPAVTIRAVPITFRYEVRGRSVLRTRYVPSKPKK